MRKVTKRKCLSSFSPTSPITFPMVNAARMVPIPSPLMRPRPMPVISAVVARHMTSKDIFTFEYLKFLMADSSRGKRSVGMIGSPQRLESAIPRHKSR